MRLRPGIASQAAEPKSVDLQFGDSPLLALVHQSGTPTNLVF